VSISQSLIDIFPVKKRSSRERSRSRDRHRRK